MWDETMMAIEVGRDLGIYKVLYKQFLPGGVMKNLVKGTWHAHTPCQMVHT